VTSTIFLTIIGSGITLMVPVLWAALGESIGEQAGVLNIGIEGVMLIGAFAAAAGLHFTASLGLGFLATIPVGILVGVVLAYLYVQRGSDQIVTGILFNLLALGLTTVLYEKFLTGAGLVNTIQSIRIPGLSAIPILGPSLFSQNILTYAAVLMAPIVYYLIRRTWFGLYIRALGERPEAGEAAGLNVDRLRWIAVILACLLGAIGGGTLVLSQTGNFTVAITSGQGFIALAVVILCRWNPIAIIGGSALFGLANAAQFQFQAVTTLHEVPKDAWLVLPYLLTIAAVAWAQSSQYPAACGIPYQHPGRAALARRTLAAVTRAK
jgi:simple sugar transport system permease protein